MVYPYYITWPAEELETDWRPATEEWDGTTRIDHGNKYTDSIATTAGDLFAFGYPTTSTAVEFADLVAQQAVAWHGCDRDPQVEGQLNAGGINGVVATYACSGRDVLRWMGVHDGFGLAVLMLVAPDADLDVARTHFEELVSQVTWDS